MSECIYLFFNNASVAAIIAVFLGAVIASNQYRKQKEIDRNNEIKKDIISDLIELQGEIRYVMLVIDRIANTYQQGDKLKTDKEFYEAVMKYEVPRLSDSINSKIPRLDARIADKLNNYFLNNNEIEKNHEEFKNTLKKWHDSIVKSKIDLTQRTSAQPQISTEKLNNKIRDLINLIWREELTSKNKKENKFNKNVEK